MPLHLLIQLPGQNTSATKIHYTLSNFEIRCDVIQGRLHASLQEILKRVCFAAISYTTRAFYGNSPQIRNDITSHLEVGQECSLKYNAL